MIDPEQDALIREHEDRRQPKDPEEVQRLGKEALEWLEKQDWQPFDVEW